MHLKRFFKGINLLLLCASGIRAQESEELKRVLVKLDKAMERLDKVERENQRLSTELQQLRQSLPPREPGAVPLEEQVAVQERRIEEVSQAKVEASQRLPIQITGMALFNAFVNSSKNGGSENPVVASPTKAPSTSGATWRQTMVGLNFQSLPSVLGADVTGGVMFDFFGGSAASLNHLLRIRTAALRLDWKNQTLTMGQDKPLISPREPDSLAQQGVSPLTGAGNPWLWMPQVRFEQRFHAGRDNLIKAQASLYETSETSNNIPVDYISTLARARPGWEGRVGYTRQLGDDRRIEVAAGFHVSKSQVLGQSVPSRLVSVDWFANPWRKIEFTGLFYKGENVANLGTLRQGITILPSGKAIPVHGDGGWAQVSYLATSRLTFHIFTGQQDDRDRDLPLGSIGKNSAYGSNVMYRLAPNVITSFEYLQLRTTYLNLGSALHNHYDLALAYQF